MKTTNLTTIAALVLIGAGGFMAGRISSSDASAAGEEGPAQTRSSGGMSHSAADNSATVSGKSRRAERETRVKATSSTEHLARLESIVRGENPLDRSRALLAFIDQLAPGDFEEAVANFRSMGITESRFGEYAMLLSGWAEVDPLAALAYATENTRGGFATGTILTTWAANDPEGAIRWAEANHSGDGANPYYAGIIRSLSVTDPERATGLLTGMPKSVERGRALDAILPQLLTKGAESTKTWISMITDESLRSGAISRVVDKLAVIDPPGTADWLIANPSQATQRQMDDVYRTWTAQDQQAAISGFAAMPVGENRSNALRGVVSSIASKDAQTAVSLLDRYPNDVTDRVVQNVVWQSFRSDPAVAVDQIARIADEHSRDRTYDRTLHAWLERDPTAATTWIQSNPLPAKVLERLNRR